MKTAFKILVLLIIIFTIASCNLFMSSPRMRSNNNDFYTQLTAFTAVPVSKNSIITMWNWKPAQDWIDSDERIEEIKIVHSTLGYPDLLNIPFVGETFSDSTKWQFTWKDLAPDTTHYFSLFMRDADGRWHPPLHVKDKLPGTTETGVVYSRLDALYIDNTGAETWDGDPLVVNNSVWAVIWFDLSDDVFIKNAVLNLNMTVSPLTEISFTALDCLLPGNGQDIWNGLQDGSLVNNTASVTFNSDQTSYDITEVVRAAAIGPEKAILIKTTDGSSILVDNNASAPYITADILK